MSFFHWCPPMIMHNTLNIKAIFIIRPCYCKIEVSEEYDIVYFHSKYSTNRYQPFPTPSIFSIIRDDFIAFIRYAALAGEQSNNNAMSDLLKHSPIPIALYMISVVCICLLLISKSCILFLYTSKLFFLLVESVSMFFVSG